ncbi:dTDP-4-dehydrorhamnose 3,5-epimerase [Basilea psittacipulmonis]|uniref:dTDP-4-dehydrorhamnose 3,5-epimerase n=1 Tax=Basilea psittacipulmonis DSM 24701 TaxID=1072685 RepID=A0A077DFA1_9BURK|nr:dTDP-4-dehydrorhamnose 3,5-epimerase [Basilea psittacipulmonis]AIL32082.1 hypothetical protein IX83_00970 [Basilea psittacipulmonis DSM 24701]
MDKKVTIFPEVFLIKPMRYHDQRGYFQESYQEENFHALGITHHWVQDNLVSSKHAVLRGLHAQKRHPQAKLVQVLQGEIYDVVVDIRLDSPTLGQYFSVYLDAEQGWQLYIPEGFAHGYLVVSETALVMYKTNRYYDPSSEVCLAWNDRDLNISWPLDSLKTAPVLSQKDQSAITYQTLLNTY